MKNRKLKSKQLKNKIKTASINLGINNLPDFLIIGAQKAGTVALSNYLNRHPKVIGASIETGFFSTNNYYKGFNWYKKKLPMRFDKNKLIFEKTPEYIYFPETPKRIYDYKKDIKLLLMIRNPVERAFSGWNHYRKYYFSENGYSKVDLIRIVNENLGDEKGKDLLELLDESEYRDFETCVKEEIQLIKKDVFRYDPSFVRRGLYYEQIMNYLEYFDREQILILESSELRNNKEEVLNSVTKFLKIPSFDFSELDLDDTHKSKYKGKIIDAESEKILKEFYRSYNEKLFNLIGKKYNWD